MDEQCCKSCLFTVDIQNYNKDSVEGYFPVNYIQYPKKTQDLYNDLPFLHKGMKTEKIEKLVTNLHKK